MLIATKSSKIKISEEITTKKIAEYLAEKIHKNTTLLFYGNIGVGKTTFIRYFINYLQKKNNLEISEVPSPTFNILHEYEINSLIVKHFDLYRLKEKSELNNLGFNENTTNCLKLVEWPELLDDNISNNFKLFFKYDEKIENRYLNMTSNTDFNFDEFKKI